MRFRPAPIGLDLVAHILEGAQGRRNDLVQAQGKDAAVVQADQFGEIGLGCFRRTGAECLVAGDAAFGGRGVGKPFKGAKLQLGFLGHLFQRGAACQQILVFGGAILDDPGGAVQGGFGAQVVLRILERDVDRLQDGMDREQCGTKVGVDRADDPGLTGCKDRRARHAQIGLGHLAQFGILGLQSTLQDKGLEGRGACVDLGLCGLGIIGCGKDKTADQAAFGPLEFVDPRVIGRAQGVLIQVHIGREHFRRQPDIGDLAHLGRGEPVCIGAVPGRQRRLVRLGNGGGQHIRRQFAPSHITAFQDPFRSRLDRRFGRGNTACNGTLDQQPGFVHADFPFELGLGQVLAAQDLGIGGAVEAAGRPAEGRGVQDRLAHPFVAHGHADPAGLFFQRGGGDKLRLDRLGQADGLGLRHADRLAGLLLIGVHLVAQRAGIIIGGDRRAADGSDGGRSARKAGHAEPAQAQNHQAHQHPDDGGFPVCPQVLHGPAFLRDRVGFL